MKGDILTVDLLVSVFEKKTLIPAINLQVQGCGESVENL